MGIFSRKSKYDITPDTKKIKSVVTKLDENLIKINAKVSVPEGYSFIIGKNGKVLDGFNSGENFFTYATLPYICRRYQIDRIVDGHQLDSITANMYLVDMGLRAAEFKTYRKVEMGTKAYGIFKAHVFGVYSYRVVNVREFLQSLLNQYDYIKTGEAEDILASWVEDAVVEELEKQNFIISDVIANNPKIAEAIKEKLKKLFKVIGLEIEELKITKYKLPKKYQSSSDKVMNRQTGDTEGIDKENLIETVENDVQQPNMAEDLSSKNEEVKNETKAEQEYVPFGNIEFKDYDKNLDSSDLKPKNTFVDLNVDMVYDNQSQKTKRCLNCGTENILSADHCVICGEKFNSDEQL